MSNSITFELHDNIVSFIKNGWAMTAFIDNETKLVEIVKNNTWNDNNGYLYCSKLRKYLHRLVMEYYFGEEQLKKLTKDGYVVDHINNSEPYNCCLDNLHVIPSDINKAKGLTVDKDIERVRLLAGVGLYCLKDRSYQIAIGFNERVFIKLDNEFKQLDDLYLTFDNFDKFYNALQLVLSWIKGSSDLNVYHLQAKKIEYREITYIKPTEEEKQSDVPIIQRDDKLFVRINNTRSEERRVGKECS